jgi:NAD/NADP transhydrogenase beta subunit
MPPDSSPKHQISKGPPLRGLFRARRKFMKLIMTLITCCLIIAAAKAAVAGLVLAVLLVLTWGAVFRPAQTLGFIASCLIISLLNRYPGWSIALVTMLILATTIRPSPQEKITANDGA